MLEQAFKAVAALFELLTTVAKGGFTRVYKRVHMIYTYLSEFVDNEKIDVERGAIIRIHNGGGNLSTSKPTYFSVLYEESRKPIGSTRNRLQNVPADKHMMALFQYLKINGSFTVDVADMPDCYLKSLYEMSGIKSSQMHFLKEKKGGFLWTQTRELHILSLNTVSNSSAFSKPDFSEAVLRLVQNIKNAL